MCYFFRPLLDLFFNGAGTEINDFSILQLIDNVISSHTQFSINHVSSNSKLRARLQTNSAQIGTQYFHLNINAVGLQGYALKECSKLISQSLMIPKEILSRLCTVMV